MFRKCSHLQSHNCNNYTYYSSIVIKYSQLKTYTERKDKNVVEILDIEKGGDYY